MSTYEIEKNNVNHTATQISGNRRAYCRVLRDTTEVKKQDRYGKEGLEGVVEELCRPSPSTDRGVPGGVWKHHTLPSRDALVTIVEMLRGVFFPGYFGPQDVDPHSIRYHVGSTLDRVAGLIEDQILRGLCFACELRADSRIRSQDRRRRGARPARREEGKYNDVFDRRATKQVGMDQRPNPEVIFESALDIDNCRECLPRSRQITNAFLKRLPDIKQLLQTDIRAAFEGDPAVTSPDEAVFCYPGIMAVTSYRVAHELWKLEVPLIPRMITEHAHSITGIDIHPGAQIGESFFIDHGTGVVIGETCIIGERVRIYQGVTLGARSFPLDEQGKPIKGIDRHPVVEDGVVIYSGATLLGRIVIGKNSIIGGNVWLTRDVPRNSRVTQSTARQETFEAGSGI